MKNGVSMHITPMTQLHSLIVKEENITSYVAMHITIKQHETKATIKQHETKARSQRGIQAHHTTIEIVCTVRKKKSFSADFSRTSEHLHYLQDYPGILLQAALHQIFFLFLCICQVLIKLYVHSDYT